MPPIPVPALQIIREEIRRTCPTPAHPLRTLCRKIAETHTPHETPSFIVKPAVMKDVAIALFKKARSENTDYNPERFCDAVVMAGASRAFAHELGYAALPRIDHDELMLLQDAGEYVLAGKWPFKPENWGLAPIDTPVGVVAPAPRDIHALGFAIVSGYCTANRVAPSSLIGLHTDEFMRAWLGRDIALDTKAPWRASLAEAGPAGTSQHYAVAVPGNA